jgi:hypothetical protein
MGDRVPPQMLLGPKSHRIFMDFQGSLRWSTRSGDLEVMWEKKKFVLWNLRWCSEIFKRFSDDVQGIVEGFVMICAQNCKKTWVSSLKETEVWGLKLKIVLWKSEAPIRQINMAIENPPFMGDFQLATVDCQRVILLGQSQSQWKINSTEEKRAWRERKRNCMIWRLSNKRPQFW